MMKTIVSILAAAFLLTGAYSFARAEPVDGSECVGQVTVLAENLQVGQELGGTITQITDAELSVLIERKGPPPIVPPFILSLAINGDRSMGMLIFHDGDCIKLPVGPAPLVDVNRFLGRVEAQARG